MPTTVAVLLTSCLKLVSSSYPTPATLDRSSTATYFAGAVRRFLRRLALEKKLHTAA